MTLGIGRHFGQGVMALGRPAHRLLTVLMTLVMLGMAGFAVLAWRLSQGPLDITWLVRRFEDAASPGGDALRVEVGAAALAWDGWRLGLDNPLDIRLADIRAARPGRAAVATIPRAELSLSFGELLRGRLVPRVIRLEGPRLRVLRAPDGAVSVDLGRMPDAGPVPETATPLDALLAQFGRPAATDRSAGRIGTWSQLARVRISDGQAEIIDRQLGTDWQAPLVELDLRRRPQGGIDGTAAVALTLGGQTAQLDATVQADPGGAATRLEVRFAPLAPASLAAAAPMLAPLQAVDAPVDGTLVVVLGPGFTPRRAELHAHMGAGTVLIGPSPIAIAGASLDVAADPAQLALSRLRVTLVGADGKSGPVVTGSGTARLADRHLAGHVALDIDRVPFADLPRYWPRLGDRPDGGGARAWVTANITAGVARALHADLALSLSAEGRMALTGATAQVTGDDLTLSWLRPVPPIEHGHAVLNLLSPDELVISGVTGRQAGSQLQLHDGSLRITGLAADDQYGAIDVGVTGPLADVLTLLRQPRLRLLSRHPVPLGDPSGQAAIQLTLTVPLDDRTTIDQIPIHAAGQLTQVHLGGVLAGKDLDNGTLDLDVTNDGLRLGGPATLAGIPATLGLQMDFRAGPPAQVLQKVTVAGTASVRQLAAAGLDAGSVLSGRLALQATLSERRDGSGTVSAHADLTDAGLALAPLGWQKQRGSAAAGDVQVTLDHDHLAALDRVALTGDGIAVAARGEVAGGTLTVLHLDQVVLGQTSVAGTIHLAQGGQPLRVALAGAALDLSGLLGHHAGEREKPAPKPETRGPPWSADVSVGRVILGPGRGLSEVTVQAEDDGLVVRRAVLSGRAGSGDAFAVRIVPDGAGRSLTAQANDAGALLRDFDVVDTVTGGSMTVTGRFDDRTAEHALTGAAEFAAFRLRDAPVAGRILKAMTLYGIADLLTGPGLSFARMSVPFRYAGGALDLLDARAFSPSLGFTAKGRVDFDRNTADVSGTVVPAYFFNTLPGKVPLVGRLFSPEPGGGVFAATYGVKGSLDDPAVSVNPLAALTPGFLRGLFGIFGK